MIELLIEKVTREIERPTFEATKQYLKGHKVEQLNGKPKVQLFDKESSEKVNILFIRLENEPFFLTFHFAKKNNALLGVSTQNANQIYLTATSQKLTFRDLSQMVTLKNLKGWSYEDYRPNGKNQYGFSRLSYEPMENRAHDFDIKLKNLLTELEKDPKGIIELAEKANALISVHHQMYISGNGGIHFDSETLKRIGDLKLAIDIDQYVYGKEIE